MQMSTTAADTPYYVLMNGKHRIGPSVVPSEDRLACSPIYGFSDKRSYDRFCATSHVALAPYPLVKVYLRDQAAAKGAGVRLIALDAAGPDEHYLHAATIEAVLEAQENRTTCVMAPYRLVFDEKAAAYRMDEDSA